MRAPGIFPSDKILHSLRKLLREHIPVVAVAVRIGHGAQQHAVFRIDKLILSVALLDFEHIDRLQTFTRQLVRIVHMPWRRTRRFPKAVRTACGSRA